MKICQKYVYIIRGTVWTVGKMRFDDGDRARQLLSRSFESVPATEFDVTKLFGDLMDKGVLMEGMDIILRPLWPFGVWNRVVVKLHGYKWNERIRLMGWDQIVSVFIDFFACNASWMGAYVSFAEGSNSILSMERIPILKDLLYLKNPLSRSQTETSPKPD